MLEYVSGYMQYVYLGSVSRERERGARARERGKKRGRLANYFSILWGRKGRCDLQISLV